jgi:membrane protease YdiL (CAAX protease family)
MREWWGVVFALGLLVVGGMVSLPTAAQTGEDINAFYSAHRQIIIAQQIAGVLLLVPFLAFARILDRRSRGQTAGRRGWLWFAALTLAAAEMATNVLALALATSPDLSPATAHAIALAGDVADAALFAAIAFFSLMTAPAERFWVRGLAVLVATLTLIRAFASPMGVTYLDAVAPIAFLGYILLLSARMIVVDHTALRAGEGTPMAPAIRSMFADNLPRGPLQLLQRYPLISYFVIAFVWTAAYDFTVQANFSDAPSFPRDFGPSLAALLVIAATAGKPGIRRLLGRLVLWRVGVRWYIFALLGIPAVYAIGILTVPGALGSFTLPSPAGWLLSPGLLAFVGTFLLGGPLFEEPGWRGFALPLMQRRWGSLAGSVILGVVWATWHLTEYVAPDFAATNGGGLNAQGFATFTLAAISFAVIITWVFNHTNGSVFMAMLVHTAINWSQLLTSALFPAAGTNETGPLISLGSLALVLVLASRGQLGYAESSPHRMDATAASA